MTGEMMWEEYCRTTNTNCNTRHDIWKLLRRRVSSVIPKVSVVPFNQVSADHAFKEGEDNRSLEKNGAKCIGEHFTPDYKAVGLKFR